MRKMKRAAALVLAGVLAAAGLSGCAKKQDPKEVYDAAVARNASLESVDMDSQMKITLSQGEEAMEMEMSINSKVDQSDKENIRLLTTSSLTMDGESLDSTTFYEGGYYYVETAGQKIKYPMDVEEIVSTIEQTVGTTELSSDSMESIELKKDGDSQIITFTADPEKMNDYLSEVMGSLGDLNALGDVDMKIDSASGEYVVGKDGYYTDMKINMAMTMESGESALSMNIDMTGTINNPGQAVEITIPDTEGYTEVDPSLSEAS